MTDVELNGPAIAFGAARNFPLAKVTARRSAPLASIRAGLNSENACAAIGTHAACLANLGLFSDAESLCRQALEIDSKTIGTDHPSHSTHLRNLAGVVAAQARFPEAETLCRQAIAILRDRLGDAHPNTRSTAENFLSLLETHNSTAPDIPALRGLLALPPP